MFTWLGVTLLRLISKHLLDRKEMMIDFFPLPSLPFGAHMLV
jgi:hypothetical protein